MERMRLHMIRLWIRRGMEVDLVVSRLVGALRDQVPERVQVYEVAAFHPLLFPFGLWRYIRTRRPTHLLSAGSDVNALTLLVVRYLGYTGSTAISFHIHLSKELELLKNFQRYKARLVIAVLRRAISANTQVIGVSEGVAEDLRRQLLLREDQVHVIYNPVITKETRERLRASLHDCPISAKPWILYVGRLVHQKGLDVLIDAYRSITGKTNAHLVILGEGPQRQEMEQKVMSCGLRQLVHFVDFKENPIPWMREADLLVLPSRYEGLGNVLIEAMACGTQVVATDCPSGPAEILDGGKYGQLVPVDDVVALATAMLKSLNGVHHVSAASLRERAQFFSADQAAMRYEAVLRNES